MGFKSDAEALLCSLGLCSLKLVCSFFVILNLFFFFCVFICYPLFVQVITCEAYFTGFFVEIFVSQIGTGGNSLRKSMVRQITWIGSLCLLQKALGSPLSSIKILSPIGFPTNWRRSHNSFLDRPLGVQLSVCLSISLSLLSHPLLGGYCISGLEPSKKASGI